jgi:hypothetical protein
MLLFNVCGALRHVKCCSVKLLKAKSRRCKSTVIEQTTFPVNYFCRIVLGEGQKVKFLHNEYEFRRVQEKVTECNLTDTCEILICVYNNFNILAYIVNKFSVKDVLWNKI